MNELQSQLNSTQTQLAETKSLVFLKDSSLTAQNKSLETLNSYIWMSMLQMNGN